MPSRASLSLGKKTTATQASGHQRTVMIHAFHFSGNILINGGRIQRKPLFSITMALWLKLDTNRGQQTVFSTCNPDNPWNSHVQYSLTITDGRVKWFHRNEKSQVTARTCLEKNRSAMRIFKLVSLNNIMIRIICRNVKSDIAHRHIHP